MNKLKIYYTIIIAIELLLTSCSYTRLLLAKENINILGSVTNDSAEYGIVRMVVSDPFGAVKVLSEAGIICKLTDVIAAETMPPVQLSAVAMRFLALVRASASREGKSLSFIFS